jgi:LPXTG-motif cell wall-anchored protein
VLAGSCITGPAITTNTLTTEIDQCNGSVNGNGSTLYCTVDVLNQVTGTVVAPLAATVNECVGSAAGGGVVGFACDSWVDPAVAPPVAVTTDPATATVVQCDGSANGGGSLVDCSVDQGSTISADIPITVNQCNASANGGGGVVVCRVRVRTVIRANSTVASYTATPTTATPVPTPLVAPPVAVSPGVGVVPPTTPVITPPTVTPPVTTSSTSRSTNRLANTGSLASTGSSDPAPLSLTGLLAVLLGVSILIAKRRMGLKPTA